MATVPDVTVLTFTDAIVRDACAGADLVLRCRDAADTKLLVIETDAPIIDVALRADRHTKAAAGLRTSAVTGEGLPELIAAIRESLVPTTVLRDPCPWAFWEA